MHDINEAMIKTPFNEQLSAIAAGFGKLLRAIVETIDRRGLKKRYLHKHKRDGTKFYRELAQALEDLPRACPAVA